MWFKQIIHEEINALSSLCYLRYFAASLISFFAPSLYIMFLFQILFRLLLASHI